MLASRNEFGSTPSLSVSFKSLRNVGVRSSLKFQNSVVNLLVLGLVGFFLKLVLHLPFTGLFRVFVFLVQYLGIYFFWILQFIGVQAFKVVTIRSVLVFYCNFKTRLCEGNSFFFLILRVIFWICEVYFITSLFL